MLDLNRDFALPDTEKKMSVERRANRTLVAQRIRLTGNLFCVQVRLRRRAGAFYLGGTFVPSKGTFHIYFFFFAGALS